MIKIFVSEFLIFLSVVYDCVNSEILVYVRMIVWIIKTRKEYGMNFTLLLARSSFPISFEIMMIEV